MQLVLTRDSVAAGDDVDAPHERHVDLPESATLADLRAWLEQHGVAVSVAGGSTWALRVDGTAVAVVAVATGRPRVVLALGDDTPVRAEQTLHLEYLLAQSPLETLALVREDPHRARLRLPVSDRPRRRARRR